MTRKKLTILSQLIILLGLVFQLSVSMNDLCKAFDGEAGLVLNMESEEKDSKNEKDGEVEDCDKILEFLPKEDECGYLVTNQNIRFSEAYYLIKYLKQPTPPPERL